MINIQSITVDVVPGTNLPPTINVIRGDSNTRYIDVTVLNNGEPLQLEDGVTVSYVYAKPDCTQVINPATISGNIVTIELSDQCLTVAGLCSCEIQFYKGSQQLTSAMFKVSVHPGVYDANALESSDEYLSLSKATNNAEEAADKANAAAEKANQAADNVKDGTTYIPNVSDDGIISWINEQGLKNPDPVNIKGPQGEPGQPGADGQAATIQVGAVITLAPGQPATVTNTGTDTAAILNFGIPRGEDGAGGGDTIIVTATGTTIQLTDSSDRPLQGLTIYGKSQQRQTTGAQLLAAPEEQVEGTTSYHYVNGILSTTGAGDDVATTFSGKFVLPAGTYTFSGEAEKKQYTTISLVDSSGASITTGGNLSFAADTKSEKEIVLTEEKTVFLKVWTNTAATDANNTIKLMLNSGSSAQPWEPYSGGVATPSPEYPQEITNIGDSGNIIITLTDNDTAAQHLTLATPDGLPGIPVTSGGNVSVVGQPYVTDTIELHANGTGKRAQRIWKHTFDGSENWKKYTASGLEGFYIISLPETMKSRYGMSNQLTPYINGLQKNAIRFGAGDTAIYCTKNEFYDDELEDKGLSNWKAHLAQNPLEVMTYLETPIETELTPEEIQEYKELHTYYPNTTISNNDNAYMGVSYIADTKLYIDNHSGGAGHQIGDGLKVSNGKLVVDTATEVERDNTKPVTSAAVYAQIGNIAALLAEI